MIKTDYVLDNKELSYELLEDGYKIYLDGGDFIHQYEPFIPNPKMTYEENAVAQIEELVAMHENALKEQQAKLEAEQKAEQEKAQLLEQIALQDEAINELASLVSELMMAKEAE
jgi:hypothetical protein